MNVRNVHERILPAPPADLAALIDNLASDDDRLWPQRIWPPMRFDRPLAVGARGGHGPIRYDVAAFEPGRMVEFRFTAPRGFVGIHRLDLEADTAGRSRLRHTIDMRTVGAARLKWPLVIRPLHDALIEDALDRATLFAGGTPLRRRWSPWVRLWRRMLAGRGPGRGERG